MLKMRDYTYLAATNLFLAQKRCGCGRYPFGLEVNGIDWVLIASFTVIMMLFVPMISEFPTVKLVRCFLGHDRK